MCPAQYHTLVAHIVDLEKGGGYGVMSATGTKSMVGDLVSEWDSGACRRSNTLVGRPPGNTGTDRQREALRVSSGYKAGRKGMVRW